MVKGRNTKKQNPVMKASPLPELAEVLHAVQSLYDDQIKPNGRLLRKRLMEAHAAKGPWDVDMQKLLEICSRTSEFEVQFDGQDEWWVRLVGRQCNFVDIPSLEDTYPQELWCSFREYFEEQKGLSLPGGRYECARALSQRSLPFLAGYSLGQVCHMVQLAISTKKILGYNLGEIVSYGCSQSMEKEQCAASNIACSGRGGRSAGMPALSWEEARFYLQELLSSSPPTGIQLPNVKRLFKSRFNANLSETALGYSKVSDLLQDPHFQDICVVKEQGQGYVVMQAPAQVINLFSLLPTVNVSPAVVQEQYVVTVTPPEHVSSFDVEPLPFDEEEMQNEPLVLVPTPSPSPGLPTWALSPATWSKNGYAGVVHNTFIDLKFPKTPLLRSERRSQTEPHNIGLKEDWTDEVNGQYDDSTSEGSHPSDASAPSSREESPNEKILKQDGLVSGSSVRIVVSDFEAMQENAAQERVHFCPNEPLCFDDCTPMTAPYRSPIPSFMETPSKTPGILRKHSEASIKERVHFCPNEPLCFDDCTPMTAPNPSPIPSFMETPTPSKTPGILRKRGEARGDKVRKTLRFSIQEDLIEAPPVKADISVFQSVWTPGTCLKHGIREHNTFVDVVMPPVTPLGPAAVRKTKSCIDIC